MKTTPWYAIVAGTVLACHTVVVAEPEWINKDFKNTTGNTRNDLHWVIGGHVKDAISQTYAPSELPDVQIDETGPAPATEVKWSGGDVADGTTVHVGVLVEWDDIPGQRFRYGAYWSQDGALQEKVSGCASVNMTFGEVIEIAVANTEDVADPPLNVNDFSYAFSDDPFDLADLTWDNPAIPWVPLPWSATIPPDGSQPMGQLPTNQCGGYLILQFAVNFAGDPPGNAGHIIVQRRVQANCPAASEWGLVILGLLVLTAGTCVLLGRHRRVCST